MRYIFLDKIEKTLWLGILWLGILCTRNWVLWELCYVGTSLLRNFVIRNFVIRNFVIRNFVIRNFLIRNFVIRNFVPVPNLYVVLWHFTRWWGPLWGQLGRRCCCRPEWWGPGSGTQLINRGSIALMLKSSSMQKIYLPHGFSKKRIDE